MNTSQDSSKLVKYALMLSRLKNHADKEQLEVDHAAGRQGLEDGCEVRTWHEQRILKKPSSHLDHV